MYNKHTWQNGEAITDGKLNNMEDGIADAHKENENNSIALKDLAEKLNKLLGTDDTTMRELQEMLDYINSNKELIDEITTQKISYTDIVDNLVTNEPGRPLSAAQGVVLKGLIDALQSAANIEHSGIREELQTLTNRINAILDSDDTTLDELSEIVAYIKNNKTLIDAITTSKVSVSDIVNDLTTNIANRPLSAAQGVVLKGLIDTLQTAVNGKAPTSHASTATTYGTGSGTNYGHVKLSDSITGTSGASGGVAATPAAVKAVNDKIPTTTETLTITYEDGTTGTLEVYRK